MSLSRATLSKIKQNLAWALVRPPPVPSPCAARVGGSDSSPCGRRAAQQPKIPGGGAVAGRQ